MAAVNVLYEVVYYAVRNDDIATLPATLKIIRNGSFEDLPDVIMTRVAKDSYLFSHVFTESGLYRIYVQSSHRTYQVRVLENPNANFHDKVMTVIREYHRATDEVEDEGEG